VAKPDACYRSERAKATQADCVAAVALADRKPDDWGSSIAGFGIARK